jgi:hypothetical protein
LILKEFGRAEGREEAERSITTSAKFKVLTWVRNFVLSRPKTSQEALPGKDVLVLFHHISTVAIAA